MMRKTTWTGRGFINVFSRRDTGFHMWAKLFELSFSIGKLSSRWSNQVGKIVLTEGQFAGAWLLINETCEEGVLDAPLNSQHRL